MANDVACRQGHKIKDTREGFERDILNPIKDALQGMTFPPSFSDIAKLIRLAPSFIELIPVAEGYGRDLRDVEDALLATCDVEPPPPPPDPFDITKAVIATNAAQDVATWSASSIITNLRVQAQRICIDHTKRGQWPRFIKSEGDDPMEGNPWVFAIIDGVLHGATYEHLRPGQECKALQPDEGGTVANRLGPHIKQGPLKDWTPKAGELVGFMVSTPARNGDQRHVDVHERSEIEVMPWPMLEAPAPTNDLEGIHVIGVHREWNIPAFEISTTINDVTMTADELIAGWPETGWPDGVFGPFDPPPEDSLHHGRLYVVNYRIRKMWGIEWLRRPGEATGTRVERWHDDGLSLIETLIAKAKDDDGDIQPGDPLGFVIATPLVKERSTALRFTAP